MPDGVLQWFDPASGDASVVRAGRELRARPGEVEPAARHPGARVHFDIHREGGTELATRVQLRRGMRSMPAHRHVGSLAGARRFDTKGSAPFPHPHSEFPVSLTSHPLEVARAWASCVDQGQLEQALWLYAPDAVVHAGGEHVSGHSGLQGWLESCPPFAAERVPDVRGLDGTVLVRWEGTGPDVPGWEVRCRIGHGQIAEQWVGEVPVEGTQAAIEGAFVATFLTRGDVGDRDVRHGREMLAHFARTIRQPVLYAKVKLAHAADPARKRPAMAEGTLDVNGEVIRAHVNAVDLAQAINALEERLQGKLEHRRGAHEVQRDFGVAPEAGEWRHTDRPTQRAEYFPRPPEERHLVRHKALAVEELTPDEAAFDMEALDYDFYLFRDLPSGEDAVIEAPTTGTYRLSRLHPSAVETGPTAMPMAVSPTPAPALTVAKALQRLDASGEPFVFFENATTRRGNVVYRRYDGHYGLIAAG